MRIEPEKWCRGYESEEGREKGESVRERYVQMVDNNNLSRLFCASDGQSRSALASSERRNRRRETEEKLTVSALNLRSSALTIFIIRVHGVSVTVSTVAHSTLCPPLGSVNHIDFVDVNVFGILRLIRSRGKDLFERSEEGRVEFFGEGDVDLYDEVSHLVVSVRGHTLSGKVLESSYEKRKITTRGVNQTVSLTRKLLNGIRSRLTRFDNFSRRNGDMESSLVEVHDSERTSSESGKKIDLDFTE